MAPKHKNKLKNLVVEGRSNVLLVKTTSPYLYSFLRYSCSKFVKISKAEI